MATVMSTTQQRVSLFDEIVHALECLMGVQYADNTHAFERGLSDGIAIRYPENVTLDDIEMACSLLSIQFTGYMFIARYHGLDITWRC